MRMHGAEPARDRAAHVAGEVDAHADSLGLGFVVVICCLAAAISKDTRRSVGLYADDENGVPEASIKSGGVVAVSPKPDGRESEGRWTGCLGKKLPPA